MIEWSRLADGGRDRGDLDTTLQRHPFPPPGAPRIASVPPPIATDPVEGGPDFHAVIDSRPARVCIWVTVAVAPLCAVVGLTASLGAGSVFLLETAFIAGAITGGCTFLLLMAWWFANRRAFSRYRMLRAPRPYSWIVFACVAGSFAVAAASLAAGHDGKAFACDGAQYCRFTSAGTVRISTAAYLQNQGGGALFLAFWMGIVATAALAASRGLMSYRVLHRGQSRWFPRRSA